jgi:uncharacterized protein (TIGR03000 family)
MFRQGSMALGALVASALLLCNPGASQAQHGGGGGHGGGGHGGGGGGHGGGGAGHGGGGWSGHAVSSGSFHSSSSFHNGNNFKNNNFRGRAIFISNGRVLFVSGGGWFGGQYYAPFGGGGFYDSSLATPDLGYGSDTPGTWYPLSADPPPVGNVPGTPQPAEPDKLLPLPRETAGNGALVQVYVPANAEVWFDDMKTKQVGETRTFKSPPLEPGKTYLYDIRVHWVDEGGQAVDNKRTIKVQAGRTAHVDFVTQ